MFTQGGPEEHADESSRSYPHHSFIRHVQRYFSNTGSAIKNMFIRFGIVCKTMLLQEFFTNVLVSSKVCALVRQWKSSLLQAD